MKSQGFTILDAVFTPEDMGHLDRPIPKHQALHNARLEAGGDGGISRANEITFTDHLAEEDPEIMSFVKRPELVDIVSALLGPDNDLYWNQSVYKAAGGTKEFPWHQDDGYTAVDPSPYLTIWLAVNDVTVENGCVWIMPGSYKQGLVSHEETPIGKACRSLTDPDQGVPVPLTAGSMAVFWSLTMHKSGLNVSDHTRKAFVIQYANAGLRYTQNSEPVPGLTPIARGGAPV
jgi:phytanoyl-CoA hydroxylase